MVRYHTATRYLFWSFEAGNHSNFRSDEAFEDRESPLLHSPRSQKDVISMAAEEAPYLQSVSDAQKAEKGSKNQENIVK